MNLQDFSGKSAIHYAAAAGHHLILKQLAGVTGCQLELEDPDDRYIELYSVTCQGRRRRRGSGGTRAPPPPPTFKSGGTLSGFVPPPTHFWAEQMF